MLIWLVLVVGHVFARTRVMPSSLGGDGRLKDRVQRRLKGYARELKAMVSSDFEAALLKATRPDMNAPKPKHVESIALSVGAFEACLSGVFELLSLSRIDARDSRRRRRRSIDSKPQGRLID